MYHNRLHKTVVRQLAKLAAPIHRQISRQAIEEIYRFAHRALGLLAAETESALSVSQSDSLVEQIGMSLVEPPPS